MKGISVCLAAVLAVSCTLDEPAEAPPPPSWEEFLEQTTRFFNGSKVYVVEWDMALTLEELRDYYNEVILQFPGKESGWKAIVHRRNGNNDIWTPSKAMDLKYCVSNDFPDKARVIQEMQDAAAAWEDHTNVDFKYVPSQDGNCTGSNSQVTFAVCPTDEHPACAFVGPSGFGACQSKTLLINYPDLDHNNWYKTSAPNVTSTGVIRHELGHILGLRHEHLHADANSNCVETSGVWSPITDYDNESVMHYPWCNGVTTTDFTLTDKDIEGIQLLYGEK